MLNAYRCMNCRLYFRCGSVGTAGMLSGDIDAAPHLFCAACGVWHEVIEYRSKPEEMLLRSKGAPVYRRVPWTFRLFHAFIDYLARRPVNHRPISNWDYVFNMVIGLLCLPLWALIWGIGKLKLLLWAALPVEKVTARWPLTSRFTYGARELLPCLHCHEPQILRAEPVCSTGNDQAQCPACGTASLRTGWPCRTVALWNHREVDL